MATYDFTDSWDLGTYTKDDESYTFSQADYSNSITLAQETYAYNQGGFGDYGSLAPGGGGGSHSSDLQASFGSSYGNGGVDLLNFVDFDYSDDGYSEWDAMNSILGDSDTVGAYATAIDAEGSGFIQVKSNFNGYNTFSSSDAGYDLEEDKLFDLWHLDGLSDGDYVTAQIVGSDTTLTDANLSVWGEIDGYMTSGGPDMLSWGYLNHDAIAIDSFNMSGDHVYGDYTYTMNIVTDWNDCSESDYESFDWGYMDYGSMSVTEYTDINWDYIQYSEFTTTSYTAINWSYAEFDEFGVDTYSDLDWGSIQYTEFSTTSYTDINWGYAEFDEFGTDIYSDLDWGSIQYTEFSTSSYSGIDWGYAEFDEFGTDIYEDLNWGYIEYSEFSSSSYSGIDWGYAEFDEFGTDIYSDLDWGYIEYGEFSASSYIDINWGYAEFSEFDDNWSDLDWGEVQYNEFGNSSYVSVDWGQVQFKEFDNKDYKLANWGKVQYNEFGKDDYKAAAWNKVKMKQFGNDDYKKINWGQVEYKEVLKSNANLKNVNWGKVETNEWDKGDLKVLTKKSTDKKLDKLDNAELDINVLKKGSSFTGDKDDDVITTSGKLLKKNVEVEGGDGNDTFVLKKGAGSMVINDFEDKVDEINFAYCGSASKIKLKQEGDDTLIYSNKDLLATVENTKKSVLKKTSNGFV